MWAVREYAQDGQPYVAASRADLHTWKAVKTPFIQGGGNMVYDTPHRLLYSADSGAGLWRVVTR